MLGQMLGRTVGFVEVNRYNYPEYEYLGAYNQENAEEDIDNRLI